MSIKVFIEAIIKFAFGALIIGLILFLPANTISYWNGWLFMGLLFVPMFIAGIVMMIKSPELLRKRLNAKEKIEPKTKGIDKNSKIVAEYIGCLTIPYSPVSTTFWFSCTSIVRDKYAFSLNTSAYKIYATINKIEEIITTIFGNTIQLYL